VKQVIEIIERCAENTCVTRPFRVRADDGNLYWIKGCGGWNRRDLCFELLAARLAEALGLPIAGFEVLDVPLAILEFCSMPGIRDLRAGPAFGSLHSDDAVSLPPVAVKKVPEEFRWKILLFDWWIQNEDRTLGRAGGNVNLLWNAEDNQLTVIDHNIAFDNDFDESKFFKNHVFCKERGQIPSEFLLEQQEAFARLTARFSEFTGDFPEEWSERDNLPGDFVPETVREILSRFDKLPDVFRRQES
jgi:hypothetical protein